MSDLTNTTRQYRLIEAIGHGGMATVYKAYQESLDRLVAVKVLLANRDPQFAARFKREARAIAALQHHNIRPIYDYGEQDGLLFFVLQYVEHGRSLHDQLGAPALRGKTLIWVYNQTKLDTTICGNGDLAASPRITVTNCGVLSPGRYIVRLYTDNSATDFDNQNPYTLLVAY
jgi:predicted Ser/Thr protein kinase